MIFGFGLLIGMIKVITFVCVKQSIVDQFKFVLARLHHIICHFPLQIVERVGIGQQIADQNGVEIVLELKMIGYFLSILLIFRTAKWSMERTSMKRSVESCTRCTCFFRTPTIDW